MEDAQDVASSHKCPLYSVTISLCEHGICGEVSWRLCNLQKVTRAARCCCHQIEDNVYNFHTASVGSFLGLRWNSK